jgi:hypothetical protein
MFQSWFSLLVSRDSLAAAGIQSMIATAPWPVCGSDVAIIGKRDGSPGSV